MFPWTAHLEWRAQRLRIELTDAQGRRLLWARLPRRPVQRHGLATLLEGLAQYGGCPLCAVTAAGAGAGPTHDVAESLSALACAGRWVRCVGDPSRTGGQP